MNLNKNYKTFILFTLIFAIILSYFYLTGESIHVHTKLRALLTIIIFITSIFVLKNTNKDLYKITFVILLVFGLITVIFNPIMLVPDESEHYARSELVSEGVLIPEFQEGKGYSIHENIFQLSFSRNLTFLDETPAFNPISNNLTFYHSCFSQNPVYGYILSGLGIFLSKILDLSVIWSLWLGRLFNFIVYLIICVYSIYRSPKYKMPLFVVSALPLALSQGASFSIDFLIISLMILATSSLIKLYDKIEYKELFLFFFLILLVGLIKVPYVLFAFLIFIIPQDRFKDKSSQYLAYLLPFIILLSCCLWSFFYASGQLYYSYRSMYFAQSNVNTTLQLNFLLNNPIDALNLICGLFIALPSVILGFFKFYHGIWIDIILPFSILYFIFFVLFSFFYPIDIKLNKKARIIVLSIVLLIFVGMNMVQYLSWTPVGQNYVEGMQSRYFIPLLLFLPMLFNFNLSEKLSINHDKINKLTIISVILALTSFIFLFLFTYY